MGARTATVGRTAACPERRGREFPRLGVVLRVASAASRAPYFVTTPYARLETRPHGVAIWSGGPFHAKAMGTGQTLCGMGTLSWKKLWDVPFSASPEPGCPACLATVACGGTRR